MTLTIGITLGLLAWILMSVLLGLALARIIKRRDQDVTVLHDEKFEETPLHEGPGSSPDNNGSGGKNP